MSSTQEQNEQYKALAAENAALKAERATIVAKLDALEAKRAFQHSTIDANIEYSLATRNLDAFQKVVTHLTKYAQAGLTSAIQLLEEATFAQQRYEKATQNYNDVDVTGEQSDSENEGE